MLCNSIHRRLASLPQHMPEVGAWLVSSAATYWVLSWRSALHAGLVDSVPRARRALEAHVNVLGEWDYRPTQWAFRPSFLSFFLFFFLFCLGWSNQLRQKEPTFYDGVEGELLLVLCKAQHLRTGHQVMRPEQISTCGLGIPQQRWKRRKHLPQHKRSSVPLHRLRSSCRSRRRDHLAEGCTR